jgi:hypothetical protein
VIAFGILRHGAHQRLPEGPLGRLGQGQRDRTYPPTWVQRFFESFGDGIAATHAALGDSIRLMGEIDQAIEAGGGWPLK